MKPSPKAFIHCQLGMMLYAADASSGPINFTKASQVLKLVFLDTLLNLHSVATGSQLCLRIVGSRSRRARACTVCEQHRLQDLL